jgi:hypothetical protein
MAHWKDQPPVASARALLLGPLPDGSRHGVHATAFEIEEVTGAGAQAGTAYRLTIGNLFGSVSWTDETLMGAVRRLNGIMRRCYGEVEEL